MYKYETHVHTSPVSKCAKSTVYETLMFYKSLGYDGVFITNHFIDGNINISRDEDYFKKIDFYFSDYEEALRISGDIGIKVFCGIEISYKGTDFLVYGVDKQWFFEHPEYEGCAMKQKLEMLKGAGAYIVHAHPFREAKYIDHIRLFPRSIDAVEILNAKRKPSENKMAKVYAEEYGFRITAGTDNHRAGITETVAGVKLKYPINTVEDYINAVKDGKVKIFLKRI